MRFPYRRRSSKAFLIIILGTFNIFSITSLVVVAWHRVSSAKFHVFFSQRSIARIENYTVRWVYSKKIVLLEVIGCSFVIVLIASCASRRERRWS